MISTTSKQDKKPITKVILKECRAEVNGFVTRAIVLWKGTYSTPSGTLQEVFHLDIIRGSRLADRLIMDNEQSALDQYYEAVQNS